MFTQQQLDFLTELLKDHEVAYYFTSCADSGYRVTDKALKLASQIMKSKSLKERGHYFQKLADEFYKQKGDKDAC